MQARKQINGKQSEWTSRLAKDVQLEMEKFKFIGRISMWFLLLFISLDFILLCISNWIVCFDYWFLRSFYPSFDEWVWLCVAWFDFTMLQCEVNEKEKATMSIRIPQINKIAW